MACVHKVSPEMLIKITSSFMPLATCMTFHACEHMNQTIFIHHSTNCLASSQLISSLFTSFHCACRALLTQEGICLTLSPEFHFLEVAYPYVARRLLTAEDPILRERLFQVSPLTSVFSLAVVACCLSVMSVCLSDWLSVCQ